MKTTSLSRQTLIAEITASLETQTIFQLANSYIQLNPQMVTLAIGDEHDSISVANIKNLVELFNTNGFKTQRDQDFDDNQAPIYQYYLYTHESARAPIANSGWFETEQEAILELFCSAQKKSLITNVNGSYEKTPTLLPTVSINTSDTLLLDDAFIVRAEDDVEIKYDTLFLPLRLTKERHDVPVDVTYFVPVTNFCVAITAKLKVPLFENNDFIRLAKFSLRKMTPSATLGEQRWYVSFYDENDNISTKFIELKTTPLGIEIHVRNDATKSTFIVMSAPYSDLFAMHDFNKLSTNNASISIRECCEQLGQLDTQVNTLLSAGGLDLVSNAGWLVEDGTGNLITPHNISSMIDKRDIPSFKACITEAPVSPATTSIIISPPHFAILNREELLGNQIFHIPFDLNNAMQLISSKFIS